MSDPEALYSELVSGDSGVLRRYAGMLEGVMSGLDTAVGTTTSAIESPTWSGRAAVAYQGRAGALVRGIQVNYAAVSRAQLVLEGAAGAYDSMVSGADHVIGFWRRRPAPLNPVIDKVLRNVVNMALLEVGRSYGRKLAGFTAAADDRVDPDDFEGEMREWLENGEKRTQDWLDDTSSSLGPLIPNTKATGDDRGLVPQGLDYDGKNLGQVYYDGDNDEGDGGDNDDPSAFSLIDEETGDETAHVNLGGEVTEVVEGSARTTDHGTPQHSGGVAFDGDNVYVTSSTKPPHLYTYSKSEIAAAKTSDPPKTVNPTKAPMELPTGASAYVTVRGGKLYVGSFTGADDADGDGTIPDGKLHVIPKNPDGDWDKDAATTIDTPPKAQGVVVRKDENGEDQYVFSTSEGRDNGSELIVQNSDGSRDDPVALPNMSEGITEVDGNIVTAYESGAEKYSDDNGPGVDWGGLDDDEALWVSPNYTYTPIDDLDLEVEPSSLRGAARSVDEVAAGLSTQAAAAAGVHVAGHLLGGVPTASAFAAAVNELVAKTERSMRVGGKTASGVADNLVDSARTYQMSDEQSAARGRHLSGRFEGLA